MSRTIELPDDVYEAVVSTAASNGTTVPEMLRQRFPVPQLPQQNSDGLPSAAKNAVRAKYVITGGKPRSEWTEADWEAHKRLTGMFGSVNSGDPDFANNERIDADLVHEYGNNHEEG